MNAEKDNDKRYLVCVRIVEGRYPPVVSTRAQCTQCGGAVWRANSSPRPEEIEILCVDCAVKLAAKAEVRTLHVMPPTKKQLESIRNVLKRKNN
jgi:hypothetical protein